MENLQEEINADLNQVEHEAATDKLQALEKMSKATLAKQEKRVLLDFAELRGLLKGLTDRQKERLNRQQLAELIKGPAKQNEQPKQSEQEQNEIELYQDAIITALNGDTQRLDLLAQKNVLGFISEASSENGELSEKAQRVIKFVKVGASAIYLGIKFTGGLSTWKNRFINLATKIKSKVSKKKNV